MLAGVEIADEGAVELQAVDGKPLQVAERRIAGAEIVDGDAKAARLEVVQRLDAATVGEAGLPQLMRGDVHGQPSDGEVLFVPPRDLGEGLAHGPRGQGEDHSGLLGQTEEARRRKSAEMRMLPTDQRFRAGDTAGVEVKDRLVMQNELLALDRSPQTALEKRRGHGAGVGRAVMLEAVVAVEDVDRPRRAGGAHVGAHADREIVQPVAVQIAVQPVAGEDADSDGRGDVQRVSVDLQRLRDRREKLARRDLDAGRPAQPRKEHQEFVARRPRHGVM